MVANIHKRSTRSTKVLKSPLLLAHLRAFHFDKEESATLLPELALDGKQPNF